MLLVGGLGIVVVGLAVLLKTRGPSDPAPAAPPPAETTAAEPVAPPTPSSGFQPVKQRFASRIPAPGAAAPAEPAASAPALLLPGIEGLPRTHETVQAAGIIDQLMQLGGSTNAPITPEQSEMISEQLRQIMNLGTPAVAAIHDFLQKNVDLAFGKSSSEGGAGAFSLRMGLLQALGNIGGPEAVAVAAGTLQTTGVPGEVGLLVRTLEQHAPGEYSEAAISASREALMTALKDPGAGHDIASLFQVIEKYGDASVVNDLRNVSNQWRYYSMMALAGLPEGQGVPAIIEMATGPGAQATGYQQIGFRLLAEVAPGNADAQAALIEQARQGKVSNWNEVAQALTGARLDFAQDLAPVTAATPRNRVAQTHHVVYGNQNFRTVQSELAPDRIAQHSALIDQLLNVTADPVAREELQQARERLMGQPQ